jgi:hypothetical protein
MTTLLRKLPSEARQTHQLPGLVNNLLSITVLCNAGCEVFVHKTCCKVTLSGKTSCKISTNPRITFGKSRLSNKGWTTQLTVHDITQSIIPLTTTPTRQLANSIPIKTPKSDTALANSLYECSNMGQLTYYY